MQRDTGDPSFPMWLLGDSNPKNWEHVLFTPLDPRHPARHSIWTPILDTMQDYIYRSSRKRIETSSLYIRNAIANPGIKPAATAVQWNETINQEVRAYALQLATYHPRLIFSFGAFAFEFARRVVQPTFPISAYTRWGATTLGKEFIQRIERFDPQKTNLLPLLHATIARGKFIESHTYFSQHQLGANYFVFTGEMLAAVLLKHQHELDIWIS